MTNMALSVSNSTLSSIVAPFIVLDGRTRMHFDFGISANRTASPSIGQVFYDTTLGYPIVYNGTQWTDFMGNPV
jgi:hypothetical protein